MNKEELEKEAEEWVISNTEIYDDKFGIEYETEPQAKEAYLAGAEPREKRIAELEKELGKLEGFLEDEKMEYYELENLKNNEITELEAYNKKLLDGDIEKHNKIVELQKENAELKTRVENQKSFLKRIRAKFNLGEIDRKEIEGYLEGDQLTKAKELIERLLKATYGEGWNYSLQVKVEAEQFLKECE